MAHDRTPDHEVQLLTAVLLEQLRQPGIHRRQVERALKVGRNPITADVLHRALAHSLPHVVRVAERTLAAVRPDLLRLHTRHQVDDLIYSAPNASDHCTAAEMFERLEAGTLSMAVTPGAASLRAPFSEEEMAVMGPRWRSDITLELRDMAAGGDYPGDAFSELWRLAGERFIYGALGPGLGHSDHGVRLVCAHALGYCGDRMGDSASTLIDVILGDEPDLPIHLILARHLRQLGLPTEAATRLWSEVLMWDWDPLTRLEALDALADIGLSDPRSRLAVRIASSDEDDIVRSTAERLLDPQQGRHA